MNPIPVSACRRQPHPKAATADETLRTALLLMKIADKVIPMDLYVILRQISWRTDLREIYHP